MPTIHPGFKLPARTEFHPTRYDGIGHCLRSITEHDVPDAFARAAAFVTDNRAVLHVAAFDMPDTAEFRRHVEAELVATYQDPGIRYSFHATRRWPDFYWLLVNRQRVHLIRVE